MKINSYYSFEVAVTTLFQCGYLLEYTSHFGQKTSTERWNNFHCGSSGIWSNSFLETKKCWYFSYIWSFSCLFKANKCYLSLGHIKHTVATCHGISHWLLICWLSSIGHRGFVSLLQDKCLVTEFPVCHLPTILLFLFLLPCLQLVLDCVSQHNHFNFTFPAVTFI